MAEQDLLKKLIAYRDNLTWEFDKEATTQWILSVQKAMVKAKMLNMDPIKQFVALKEIKVKECELELLHNRNMTEDERKRIFDKRDILISDINFFKEAQQIVDAAEKEVKKIEE